MTSILNTSIITSDGCYRLETIDLGRAKEMTRDGITSYIGHEATANILTMLLGIEVPFNRASYIQKTGESALIFKLNRRLPVGADIRTEEEINEIGYTFQVLTKIN